MNTCTRITQNVKLEDHPPRARIGENMGECEVCGATKVSTRTAIRARSSIEACIICMEKMGIDVEATPSGTRQSSIPNASAHKSSSRTTVPRRKRKDIMHRTSKVLRSDFGSAIRQAREEKGWDQRELAKRMAERVNIIQHTEGGKHPTDGVITKFERILNIKLMETRESEEETTIHRSTDRPMTMEDLYEQAKKDLRGE